MADSGDSSNFNVDDITKGTKEATKKVKGFSVSLTEERDSIRALNPELITHRDHMKNVEQGAKDAAKANETLVEVLQKQAIALREAYREYTSLSGIVRSAGTEVGRYGKKLMELASIKGHYLRQLEYIREAQDLNSKSMTNYSSAVGKASSNMQRQLDNITASNLRAAKVAGEFNASLKEIEETQKDVRNRFATQMAAYKDLNATSEHLVKSTLILSRTMGISASQAAQDMEERMQVTNKTLKEVEKESFLVAKAVDKYTEALSKNGEEALRTAKFTKQQLWKAIHDANKEFQSGQLDMAAYAEALAPLAAKMEAMGRTPAEIMKATKDFAKAMSGMQAADLSNLFGIQGADALINKLESSRQDMDDGTRKRFDQTLELVKSTPDISNVRRMEMIIEAVRGSRVYTREVVKSAAEVGNQEVLARILQQSSGNSMSATDSQLMAKEMQAGGVIDQAYSNSPDKQNLDKQSVEWRKKMEDLAKKVVTPTDKAALATLKIERTLNSIEVWLKRSLYAALGLIAARLLIGGFRGIRGIQANRAAGTGWHGLRTPPTAAATTAATTATTAATTATTAATTATKATVEATKAVNTATTTATAITKAAPAATRMGRAGQALRGAGSRLRALPGQAANLVNSTGALGFGLASLGIGTALYKGLTTKGGTSDKMTATGEGLLNVSTAGLYELIGKPVEKAIYNGLSDSNKRSMGGDVSYSRMVAEGARGLIGSGKEQKIIEEMDRVRVTRRTMLSKKEVEQYNVYSEMLKKLKIGKHLLSEEEQKQVEAAKKYTKKYKRWVELRTEGFKKSIAATSAGQYTDTVAEAEKVNRGSFAHIQDPKEKTRAIMDRIIKQSGRLYRYGGGQQALHDLLGGQGDSGKAFLAKLKDLGADVDYAKEVSPKILDRYKLQARYHGRVGSEMGGKFNAEELRTYESIKQARMKKGMDTNADAIFEELRQRKQGSEASMQARSTSLKISTDVGAGSEGGDSATKYDASTNKLTIMLPGRPLVLDINPIAAGVTDSTQKSNMIDNSTSG